MGCYVLLKVFRLMFNSVTVDERQIMAVRPRG